MFPEAPHRFKPSRTAWAILLASMMLAGLLAAVTWRNLDREERMMEDFLLQEGLTLIRAFEAGARSSMMMRRDGSLETLVRETAREETVAYIAIVDEEGRLVAGAGSWEGEFPVSDVLSAEGPCADLKEDGGEGAVFEVARKFQPLSGPPAMGRRMKCSMNSFGGRGDLRQAIFVGLASGEFTAARGEDVRQSLIMGALLLLMGSAGLYFLFLSQGARVARATLENMELYTRNVIESIPAGLITVDRQRRIVASNRRALEITGRQGPLEGNLGDLAGSGRCEIEPLLEEGRPLLEVPIDCRRPDGTSVPVKVSSSPIHDREGNGLGTVLILRDLREIREMEEALERSRRHAALGKMAAGIAHEIRNPLGTLRGFAQYFAKAKEEAPRAEEYAELMIGEVDRLNRTVSALLQFASPRQPQLEEVKIEELLKRSARFVEEDMKAKGLTLAAEWPEEEPSPLRADPDLLTQVLLNLLQNAMAASSDGGEIGLGAEVAEEEARIWVRDTGKGMNPEERERMFDPFFTTRKDGTGLGLAVVQQIVEEHRGRIEVQSAPEQGTRITLILPRED